MTHTFPKSRVCLIDISLPFEEGFKRALSFKSKYNIPLNTADGRRIVTSFCVETIVNNFNSIKGPFPKATYISKNKIPSSLMFFVENYFEGILKQLPIYYCGVCSSTCPDLEHVAARELKQNNTKRDYVNLLSKLKVRKIAQ